MFTPSPEQVAAVSALVQGAAGLFAFRLIKVSGRRWAWALLAIGMTGMGLRRIASVYRLSHGALDAVSDMQFEVLGLLISVCMLAGVLMIEPIFRSINEMTHHLSESEARYRKVLEHSLEGVLVFDPLSGSIRTANPRFQMLFGYDLPELRNMTVFDLVEGEGVREKVNTLLLEGKVFAGERMVSKKDGTPLTVDVSASLVEKGTEKLAFAFVHDLSKMKEAQAQKERLIVELEAALSKVKLLSGLIPICATCKKIRDDKGYWRELEQYITDHSEAGFTHGICPECKERFLKEYAAGESRSG